MALKKNKLLEDLDLLRETINQEETTEICTDKVLKEIASKKPLKTSDFLAISGISKSFISKHSSRFIQVILKHQNNDVNEVKVSKKAHKTLDNYKDRLTNISKRNSNLYLGKITKRVNFDLVSLDLEKEVVSFLTNSKTSTLKLKLDSTHFGEKSQRDITTLYRETNKYFKETGAYDFYIAYPYVEGIFKKDGFAIKAPLLFFPVKLKRNRRDFSIIKDKDKDILYNRDLLLTISKIDKNKIEQMGPFITDFNEKTITDVVIPFYKKNGIIIKQEQNVFSFERYKNELKDDFNKRKKGVFILKEYLTIGRYKLYSSMIQKDITAILESNKYNQLLEGLIDESNLYSDEKEVIYNVASNQVDEEKLLYINEVNYSQEKVIDLLNKEKKLVIWGPPGTGKSQTITSLIAASVLKGENVLVVSEKKVALDVIYSRLKNTAKYTMFIDDAENKQNFYQKLKAFIDPVAPQRTLNNDIFVLEQEIKEILSTMDKSLDLLYNQKIQDVPIYQLYKNYVKDKDIIEGLSPTKIHQMIQGVYKKPLFSELRSIQKTFDKYSNLKEYIDYFNIMKKYPLFLKLETKITRSNKLEFKEFTKTYDMYKSLVRRHRFLKKKRLKKEFLKLYSKKLLFMTKKIAIDSKYMKLILNDDNLHKYIAGNIGNLNKIKTKFEKLTKEELLFLEMMIKNPILKDIKDVAKMRHYIFDAFYTGYLEEVKAKNQKNLYILDKYQEKINKLNNLIEDKKRVTTESFEMELYKHALNFSNSKRIMDIKRTLESTRKMSPKAFINIFQLELMNNARVWMMTPEVVSAIIPLVYGMFDLVVFDEASQMYVEKGIPAIYRAKKVVIAGDTKQLRPSNLGVGRLDNDDEFYEEEVLRNISLDAKSLLDLARYKFDETILNYHYRSKYEELIAFSNNAFYDGKLIVSPNQTTSQKPPIEYVYVKDGVFENRKNKNEALQVVKLIKKIFRERKNNETIGVITFSSTQRDEIENVIDEELIKNTTYQKQFEKELFRTQNGEDISLFIKNIENVQGDERDIIIFSMGYAKDPSGVVKRQFGWLNNEGGQNRLNVAISRAKRKIYFVSSLYPEELKVDDLKSTGPKLLKNYMRYCYYIANEKPEMAKKILTKLCATGESTGQEKLSDLIVDVQKRLKNNNLLVKTSLGIGNESIHLGIYDEVTSSYKLGIICDVVNQKQANARRDLLHLEKYLNARNWNIYRVFSSNWYTNPNKELKKIRELLNGKRGSK